MTFQRRFTDHAQAVAVLGRPIARPAPPAIDAEFVNAAFGSLDHPERCSSRLHGKAAALTERGWPYGPAMQDLHAHLSVGGTGRVLEWLGDGPTAERPD